MRKKFSSYSSAVLKRFFPKTTESKVIWVSSNEGNLLRSEKKNKENQYRFALGACETYHTLSLSCIGNYDVINCLLNKVISKFVFKNRRSSGVKRIDRLF